MTTGYRTIQTKGTYEALQEVRDFLVACGWSDETPAGQDDELHTALGFLLNSDGENGNRDIWLHLFLHSSSSAYAISSAPWFSYLTTQINPSSTEFDVDDASDIAASTDFVVRVGSEYIRIASVSGNTLYISERGVVQTAIGTHTIGSQVGMYSGTYLFCETYVLCDWTNPIVESSSAATCSKTGAASVPGLSGFKADNFSFESILKIVDGAEAGKMRRVVDYNESTGTFITQPFKNSPGTANVGVVSQGFMPALSNRSTLPSASNMFPIMPWPGSNQPIWMYGDKNGFVFAGRYDTSQYWGYHAGEPLSLVTNDVTTLTSPATAGDMSIEVANRHLFKEGSYKYRMFSQSSADWEPNNDRPSPEPDLDPEDLPNEYITVHTIVPGVGDAGTLQLGVPLVYSYSSGAVVGENPKPIGRSGYDSDWEHTALVQNSSAYRAWIPCVEHIPWGWVGSNAGRYRRHHWRATASDASPWTPANNVEVQNGCASPYPAWGMAGEYKNTEYWADPAYLMDRKFCGRIVLTCSDWDGTYDHSFRLLGLLPFVYFYPAGDPGSIPAGAAAEDTVYAPWNGTVQKFRILPIQNDDSVGTSSYHYCLLGPEIDV